ncbi:MAG TPA: class I SAM-dependent methyltransferase [Steroidobacter sp.]|uniref:class I SAM-dependent methyltransferase n=1 Tax=Steroidobacter sp. TaxID=1978227 RepID=UPI002EDB3122
MKRSIKRIKHAVRELVGYKRPIKAKSDPLPFKVLAAEGITGWFSRRECRRLYMTVAMSGGAILEIGHFLGRSTACICEAIRDTRRPRTFRSYDLGFRSAEEFKAYYDRLHKTDVDVPPQYQQIVFSKNTTTTEVATGNLRRLGLDSFVTLISGDAFELDRDTYDLIFCDATHEPHEIEANVPRLVAHSNPGCIWALHDMNQVNIERVLALANVEFCELTGSLGTFMYRG